MLYSRHNIPWIKDKWSYNKITLHLRDTGEAIDDHARKRSKSTENFMSHMEIGFVY